MPVTYKSETYTARGDGRVRNFRRGMPNRGLKGSRAGGMNRHFRFEVNYDVKSSCIDSLIRTLKNGVDFLVI